MEEKLGTKYLINLATKKGFDRFKLQKGISIPLHDGMDEFKYFPRITLSFLQTWLRKTHKFHIEICYMDNVLKYGFKIIDITTNTEITDFRFKIGGFEYDKALENGLKHSLNLIK